ncbi:hypothetical protein MANES_03G198850v8 [Manihot esculenta]|uniref:Uncharacterized protein n=1 Tax=Manihot esculenta TaxID=3983 RepID=A0ACB7I3R7_MANES|nr:hypothetical protein MANES_03G198850v8 [Manihot esculenta]
MYSFYCFWLDFYFMPLCRRQYRSFVAIPCHGRATMMVSWICFFAFSNYFTGLQYFFFIGCFLRLSCGLSIGGSASALRRYSISAMLTIRDCIPVSGNSHSHSYTID